MNLFSAINRQLPLFALGCAMLLLVWTLQHHFLQRSGVESAPQAITAITTTDTSTPTIQAMLTPEELNQITERHLFGTVEKPKIMEPKTIEKPKVVEPDFSNLPETRIPLKLSGIAFSPDDKRAFAMIITADGKQAEYQAGELIGKDAKVHVIEEKRVVIDRDGNFEALNLPEIGNTNRNVSRPQRPRNNRAQSNRPNQRTAKPVRPTPDS